MTIYLCFISGRVYCKGFSESFCTLSECTKHDYPAILAHLKPIMEKYLEAYPNVEHLHFQTDGPTSQYKNRNLYAILFSFIADSFPQSNLGFWSPPRVPRASDGSIPDDPRMSMTPPTTCHMPGSLTFALALRLRRRITRRSLPILAAVLRRPRRV